jgi:transcriptional regulator with GAF, ATPase, and Fis domain
MGRRVSKSKENIKEESMKSISTWESERLNVTSARPNNEGSGASPRSNISALKELTLRLLREVQAITEVRTLSLEGGVDFYGEVSRFEVDLIKRALLQTAGHQGRAARLLNLKVTTLNSKIKHYNIALNGFANGYPLIETKELDNHSHI